MNSAFVRKTTGDRVFDAVNHIAFGLFTILCIFPFYYILINSISDNRMVLNGEILFWPKEIHFQNYKQIFEIDQIANSFVVSIARTVLGTSLSLITTSFLGYALSRPELWHRKLWYRLVVATMYFNAGLIPWFMLMKALHFMNNFFAYIIPGMISAFNLMLFKTYVESIPTSLEESADIDGAWYLVKYTRIIMPLCKPIIATLMIFSAVGQWNDFMTTVYLVTDAKLFTLQYRLYQYLNEANSVAQMIKDLSEAGGGSAVMLDVSARLSSTSLKMSITIVAVLPILFVYPIFQKYFVGGIMIGAVKG
ncbi:MAG: carbohydrate ABC transporter permease [Christensenellales bacterium]|jgi:putative aldouronate transport system permease protein